MIYVGANDVGGAGSVQIIPSSPQTEHSVDGHEAAANQSDAYGEDSLQDLLAQLEQKVEELEGMIEDSILKEFKKIIEYMQEELPKEAKLAIELKLPEN